MAYQLWPNMAHSYILFTKGESKAKKWERVRKRERQGKRKRIEPSR